tara:strand:- start:210 stop:455 length:246 start_codon:yes stop_codon:yes gene_type:complete
VLDLKIGKDQEVEQHVEDGDVNNMKSRGLGDSIHKFTKATGIKSVVDRVSRGLNIPCGCEARREALNRMVPYNKSFKMKNK